MIPMGTYVSVKTMNDTVCGTVVGYTHTTDNDDLHLIKTDILLSYKECDMTTSIMVAHESCIYIIQ